MDPTLQAVRVDEGSGELAIHAVKLNERGLDERWNTTAKNVTAFSVFHPELEPVLIWSMAGLDDKITHRLRLALAQLPSNENAEMSIAKVTYTSVTYDSGQPRPEIPIPQPDSAYGGPVYPPHARNWVSRGPPLPLPSSHHPAMPPPPASGPPPAPPYHSSPNGMDEALPTIVICFMFSTFLIFAMFCLLVLVRLMSRHTERQRLLPPIWDSPPPYSPQTRSYGVYGRTQNKRNQQR